ncbi:hypothetical protein SSX86_012253 [Deinandra increscens subsp. villosa]|uniref:NB-ARC domains-containing protein n=1 Tax=Deinandra increscens subsp. villosa TaxID=3103831 RepID=A0AAP0H1C5_9ASTR
MAELVLSAFLTVLFEKLASTALKKIASYKGIDADIKKWQRSLTQIQGVLYDASGKEISSPTVKRWLNDLQHLAYDIDDVLDELATDAMHREFNHESEGINSKVRKLIPSCCTDFSRNTTRMHDKLDTITAKLKELLEEKTELGLKVEEESRPKNSNRRLQTSVVDSSSIVGRHVEKEVLVKKLLGGESGHQNFSIVPIVGMGGVGKTTLAKLVYDEDRVKVHFGLKAWVCVSDDFDSFAISKVIFQSVTSENKDFADLNLLQVALRDHLMGKRFLLVLDDVWSESSEDWETLVAPFHTCAPGSKIIITTRKDQLLKKLRCNQLNQLESLSPEDALSLIALQALGATNFDSHSSLKPHAEGIVKKCHGLPLALKALGRLLGTKNDEEYWKKVLDSEIWNLPVEGEIIPALKLSYHDLSACLKQLFAYCSLFPKDCVFDKEELVLLWMAEGFLHQSPLKDSTEESMGREYFDELFSRSFFQYAPNNKSRFVMHDMMNDLATSVAGEFFVRLDNETENSSREELLMKYRHMSFVREKYVTYKKLENFKRAKSLRTFLAASVGVVESWQDFYLSNKILVDLLLELPLLRVLCLSAFKISEVPESIGTLRHLRYLNLSQTSITHLPESVCNLYNLETLIIFGCGYLTKLPNNFLKLKNLRHLDIKDTPLVKHMPLGIGDLKKLQTLSKIISGDESGFEIRKLKEFKNLCGKISIVGLDKLKNAIHAREANFSQKRFSELDLVWSDDEPRNEMLEKEVLNELKPCNDKLIKLDIRSYGGLEFPNWVGDPSFPRLKHVSLHNCKRCTSLPPLGRLPFLKELFIEGLDGVKVVGMELLGTCHEFASLEILSFRRMSGWSKWSTNNGRVVFPRLQELLIQDCPNLVEITLETLPSLKVLEIRKCDSGVLKSIVQVALAVTKLNIRVISGLNDAVWRVVMEYLGAIKELRIAGCNEIRYLWESEVVAGKLFVNLKKLDVNECANLVSLGEEEDEDNCRSNLLTSLRMLEVSYCKNMERCRCPYSIERLQVWNCDSITDVSLPTEGQKLKSLMINGCKNLLEREWGGQKMNTRMLEVVDIYGWSNLKSIVELKYLVHLTKLWISDCESLESFPENDLANLTSLKDLQIHNCPRMDACFPRGIWPPNLQFLTIGNLKKSISEWGPQNFPSSLVELELYGGDEDEVIGSLGQISHLLPSSLTSLTLDRFEKLESADGMGLQHLTSLQLLFFNKCPNLNKLSNLQHLTSIKRLICWECPNLSTLSHPQHLTSLQHLYFWNCPNLMDLPEVLLPSLLSLSIEGDCREDLKERCSSKGGSYWPLISHIPDIYIS